MRSKKNSHIYKISDGTSKKEKLSGISPHFFFFIYFYLFFDVRMPPSDLPSNMKPAEGGVSDDKSIEQNIDDIYGISVKRKI